MPPKAKTTSTDRSRTYTQDEVDKLLAEQKTATEHQTARLSALVVEQRLSRALGASGALPEAVSTAAVVFAEHATLELGEDGEDDRLVVRLEGQSYEGSRIEKAAKRFLEMKSFYKGDPSEEGGSERRSARGGSSPASGNRDFENMSATDLIATAYK